MQPPVINTVQATLVTIVLATDAGQEPIVIAQGHIDGVNAVVLALDNQLGEHDCSAAVFGSISDVVLPRSAMRGVDDELIGVEVVGCCRCDGGNVGPVTRLRHCKGTGNLQRHDAWQPLAVMHLRAKVHDGGTKESPLHAGLNLKGGVRQDDLLKTGDVATGVFATAHDRGKSQVHGTRVGEAL